MRSITLRCCVVLFICCAGVAQVAPAPAAAPYTQQNPGWSDHYRRATISFGRIMVDHGREVFAVIGAGVIVAVDDRTGFVVTTKHMFDDPSQSWHPSELRVRFAWQEGRSVEEEHGLPIKLTDSTGKNLWTPGPDGSDLAALPLPQVFTGLPLHAIGLQDFASPEDVYDGATVFIFGFPGFVGNDRLVRAVTRSGSVAWIDPAGPERPFLVDANIFLGNSGGPVLKVPTGLSREGSFIVGGRVAFLGIVSQNFTNFYSVTAEGRIIITKWPDMPLPSLVQVGVNGIGGLGLVEPAARVRTLVLGMKKNQQ